ncbi:hypothetical protein V8B97DRAFT_161181 [Scleroderma yunnanense]
MPFVFVYHALLCVFAYDAISYARMRSRCGDDVTAPIADLCFVNLTVFFVHCLSANQIEAIRSMPVQYKASHRCS